MTTTHPLNGPGAMASGRRTRMGSRAAEAPPSPVGDVYQRLLQKRIVVLGQEVDDDIANRICAELLLLSAEDSAPSMGQSLLCAGAKGKRYALPHARIVMHQPLGGIGGTASDIKIQ